MDKRIKEIYKLILKQDARVIHCLDYKKYYEIHLEWNIEEWPLGISSNVAYFDDYAPRDWVQNKLIALSCIKEK